MARIIEEQKIVNNHISNYLDTITDFSKYLEGTPTFCRYYSKDVNASTVDVGLQNVNQNIGNESPIKYNLIKNFPLYNMEEASLSIDYDEETGTDTNIEITAVMLPDCGIRPLVGDYFACNSIKRSMELFFKIHDIEIGNINDRTLYKITAHYASPDENEIFIQEQVTSIYQTSYDNIGQNSKSGKIVIKEDIFNIIEDLKEAKNKIKDFYILNFYDKNLNTFIYNDNEGIVHYDNLLMKFIQKNKLFIANKTFLKNIYIEPLLLFDGKENKLYNNSIYSYIERRDPSRRYYEYVLDDTFHLNNQAHTIFSLNKHRYPLAKEVLHYPAKVVEFEEGHSILLDRNGDIVLDINGEIVLVRDVYEKTVTKELLTNYDFLRILDLYMNRYDLKCPICGRTDMHSHAVNRSTFNALLTSKSLINNNEEYENFTMEVNKEDNVIFVARKDNMNKRLFTFFGPSDERELNVRSNQPIPSNVQNGRIINRNNKYFMYVNDNNGKRVLLPIEGNISTNQATAWTMEEENIVNERSKYLDILTKAIVEYELNDNDLDAYIMLPFMIYIIDVIINEYELNV